MSIFLGVYIVFKEVGFMFEYIDFVIEEMLLKVYGWGLVDFVDVFCECEVFDMVSIYWILYCVKELGLGIKIYVEQFGCSGGV